MEPLDFTSLINWSFQIISALWPYFIYWLAIGLLSWIVGNIFLSLFIYHDFSTGFHDGYEFIFLGPITMIVVIYECIIIYKNNHHKITN